MKRILGLDLGTNFIGWVIGWLLIEQDQYFEKKQEKSSFKEEILLTNNRIQIKKPLSSTRAKTF